MSIYSRLKSAMDVLRFGVRPSIVQYSVSSRYSHLLKVARQVNPTSMVEIGVWRGDRAVQFLSELPQLRLYVGFDLFEDISDQRYMAESMGKCSPVLKNAVGERLQQVNRQVDCVIELVQGLTEDTLPEFVKNNERKFDFIFIDGGHSIETILNDWHYSQRLLAPEGVVVFDDYYLNNSSRGAKTLIDDLLKNDNYRVRFFPMIEDIIEDLQITMVTLKRVR
jgi:predicted O-methyltransferase YrrM